MGLIKRVKKLEEKIDKLEEKLIFLQQMCEKNERDVADVNNRITGINDYQKEIIEQNKKSQEDRTILLKEYLHGPEEEEG